MGANPPVVYILHGEDEYEITQYIDKIKEKMGDPALAEMNTTRLDGRTASFQDLEVAASTPPFLTKRRLVILTHPRARLGSEANRPKLEPILMRVPPEVALVLVEYKSLTDERDRKKGKLHWLERLGKEGGERFILKTCLLPDGDAMVQRITGLAEDQGTQITLPAAELLATWIGNDPRAASQEIQKLLAYANYNRPIEIEDVEHLTGDHGRGDIFEMVDAIGELNGRRALDMLHRLLNEQDAMSIFGMVIRQFRLLLLAREILDAGGQTRDVYEKLKPNPFRVNFYAAEKIAGQARKFSLPDLEAIYARLLDLDAGLKTGEIDGEIDLDALIAGITQ